MESEVLVYGKGAAQAANRGSRGYFSVTFEERDGRLGFFVKPLQLLHGSAQNERQNSGAPATLRQRKEDGVFQHLFIFREQEASSRVLAIRAGLPVYQHVYNSLGAKRMNSALRGTPLRGVYHSGIQIGPETAQDGSGGEK